jgi:hypothetical protein
MNRKGICYDVGRVMMGGNWRPKFDPKIVRLELEIIKGDLQANAVRICGLDIHRLVTASEIALSEGLEVWLSPEMWDKSQEETLGYITEASLAAESLRKKWPGKLVFSLGSELTLFMKGIMEGNNFFERMNNPSFWESVRSGKHNKPLNDFLARANKAVRENFHGEVTYFSVPFERVNWSTLDYAGIDLYRDGRSRDMYDRVLKSFPTFEKPVVIGEFGCCTYKGAETLGGNGFVIMFGMMKNLDPNITLPKVISDTIAVIPRVDGHYMRDEDLQAREVVDQLRLLDQAGVEGAFVFTFVSPNSPYNEDPRSDSDLGSFSLVKSYVEKETVEEFAQQVVRQGKELLGVELDPKVLVKFESNVGKHGETYPDMTWEPKESFRAVGDYYSKH